MHLLKRMQRPTHRADPSTNSELWLLLMRQCGFIDDSRRPALMHHVHGTGGCVWGGRENVQTLCP